MACVIIEPIIGSGGAFKVEDELLKQIRELCDTHGVLLIFDEIVSGFRFQYGLYQDKIGVYPDLTALGKIIGGGFPIGGLGGLEEIMDRANPSIDQPHMVTIGGGTFSSHPITMTAGIATLDALKERKDDYQHLNRLGDYLKEKLNAVFEENNEKYLSTNFGSLIFINCLKKNPWEESIPITSMKSILDKREQTLLQLSLLNRKIYGNHGIGALSFQHKKKDLDSLIETLNAIILERKKYN